MEHYPSGIFVCVISTVVLLIACHVSSFASRHGQFGIHCYSWNNSRLCTVVVIDHICHQICRRASTPWGSFRTPRRERLTADIAIMSMLFELTAVVSANGFLYLYQFIYLGHNDSPLKLLQSFVLHTSVPLVIEWFL